MRNVESYLEGELNAVMACGRAIEEALEAINKKVFQSISADEKLFILLEFRGIMLRASQLIKDKNTELNIGGKQ